ncbi:MAG: hypothetical protein ABS84_15570 [Rubrivivax sp. SCN 71-131]|nr:MAG: hypothetical protein ABS84_15570 [Rubrivivax sp. SCN 71-131]
MADPIVPRAPRRPRLALSTSDTFDRLVLAGFVVFVLVLLAGAFDDELHAPAELAYVQELQGDELLRALEALGYPELAGDVEGEA